MQTNKRWAALLGAALLVAAVPVVSAQLPPGLTLSFALGDHLCLTPPPVTRPTMQQGLCAGVVAAGVRVAG